MKDDRRNKNKCPKCGGDVELKDGRLECLSCDYGQVERRAEDTGWEHGVDGF